MDKTNKKKIVNSLEVGDSLLITNFNDNSNRLSLVLRISNDTIRFKDIIRSFDFRKEDLINSEYIIIEKVN